MIDVVRLKHKRRQLEQPAGHRSGTDAGPKQPRHHGGKIVSPVEAIFEFREI
jgi:hypothetical protein